MNLNEYKKLNYDERNALPKKLKNEMQQFEAADYLYSYFCDSMTKTDQPIKVFCSVGSVAKSGMSRRIKLYVAIDGDIIRISHLAAKILESNLNDNGIRIDGCGMDMGFAMVNDLEYRLNKILGTVFKLKQIWL